MLIPIEYKNRRVLTTQQLADSYDTSTDNISKNYSRNLGRYVLGVHYYILEGEELKDIKASGQFVGLPTNVNKLFLWTERGAFHHAKSLGTDKAWDVYESLVDSYFRSREVKQYIETLSPQTKLLLQLSESIAKAEYEQQQIRQLAAEAKSGLDQARETISNIKDTMGHRDENWRKWVNSTLAKAAQAMGANEKESFREIKAESYSLLEERGRCKLNARLTYYRARLIGNGASKTKTTEANKLDCIEADVRLKEIYTSIVKELSIKYVA